MATLKLFGNNIAPACKYCAEAMQQVGDNVLCMKRGIVPPEHFCRKFIYDPIKRIPAKPMPLETYTEEDFSIE